MVFDRSTHRAEEFADDPEIGTESVGSLDRLVGPDPELRRIDITHTEHVGDHLERQRYGECCDEVDRFRPGDRLCSRGVVDDSTGQLAQAGFEAGDGTRSEGPADQCPESSVIGRVHHEDRPRGVRIRAQWIVDEHAGRRTEAHRIARGRAHVGVAGDGAPTRCEGVDRCVGAQPGAGRVDIVEPPLRIVGSNAGRHDAHRNRTRRLTSMNRPELAEERARFASWLSARLDTAVDITPFDVPNHGGFSNDTWMTEARFAGETRGLVVRLAPTGDALFPVYDLGEQARVLDVLRRDGAVPVPAVLWEEPDPSVLGRAFYVMDRVDGRIPPDNPGHHFAGWVKALGADDQRRLLDAALGAMADIHRLDWQRSGLGFLAGLGLDDDIARWREYIAWAGVDVPGIDAAFAWCVANRPAEPAAALVWGDARLGNLIFDDDLGVRAVLDWEMATLGPPELDLGWYLFLERVALQFTAQLPGFGDRDDCVARYAARLGRPVVDLHWYEVWGGVRSAAVHHRLARLRGDAPGFDPVVDTLTALVAAG